MSRDYYETEQYRRETEERKDKEREKRQEIKYQIKLELLKFIEKHAEIASTWDERDEAIELAFNLIVNDIILENEIKRVVFV